LFYLRYYQRFVRLPLLRELVNGVTVLFGRVVLKQDQVVVETQQPQRSGLRIGEILIPADKPVILYRTHREELINKSTRSESTG
jgi:hypothetical protein